MIQQKAERKTIGKNQNHLRMAELEHKIINLTENDNEQSDIDSFREVWKHSTSGKKSNHPIRIYDDYSRKHGLDSHKI